MDTKETNDERPPLMPNAKLQPCGQICDPDIDLNKGCGTCGAWKTEEKEHYCYECGHFHYDTTMGMGGSDWCDCKDGYTYIRNEGETDCEYWKSHNHPDIIKKEKIYAFLHGYEKYPDMQFIYDNCFKEMIDKATYEELQDIMVSIMGKVYNAAYSRCYIALRDHMGSFIEFPDQSVSEHKGWKKEDKLDDMIKMSSSLACKYGFEVWYLHKYTSEHRLREDCDICLRYSKKDGREFYQFNDLLLEFMRFIPSEYSDRIHFDMGNTLKNEGV